MWSILIVTLPSQPNAVRMRVWRGLKALGCACLRDGAYLLPLEQAALLEPLATEVREHGGSASVLALSPRDDAQKAEVLALFDRSEAYAAWQQEARALQRALGSLPEAEARRRWRVVAESLQAVGRIDHYPGAAAEQADAELQALRRAVDQQFSRGEPHPQAGPPLARLDAARFRGRRWATRARPWVDRLASAWLIRRFIDPEAHFIWLTPQDGVLRPPRGVLGFDYDGARFTHVGQRVSFEVLMSSFGLEADTRLLRVAAAVHYLDVGGIPVPEAAGLETVLAGLKALHADDDALTLAASAVFDALYAAPGAPA